MLTQEPIYKPSSIFCFKPILLSAHKLTLLIYGDNIIIFAAIVNIIYSIIVEFAFWIEDLLNNKSGELFLNRHNLFLRYDFIAYLLDLWKKGIINFD